MEILAAVIVGVGLGFLKWQVRSAHWSNRTHNKDAGMLNHHLDSAGGAA
jgi:hypothetical protein